MHRMYTLTGREVPESERTLYGQLAKNCQRRKFLYDHGTEKDFAEYQRLEKDYVRIIEKIEQIRDAKHYKIRTMTLGTIER